MRLHIVCASWIFGVLYVYLQLMQCHNQFNKVTKVQMSILNSDRTLSGRGAWGWGSMKFSVCFVEHVWVSIQCAPKQCARIIEQCNVMHWNMIEHNTMQCNPNVIQKTALRTMHASLNKHAWLRNRVKCPQLHWHCICKTYNVFRIDIHAPFQCSLYISVS